MCMALTSSLAGRCAKREVALTREITLTGNGLLIGGVKEEVLATIRAGIKKTTLSLKEQG